MRQAFNSRMFLMDVSYFGAVAKPVPFFIRQVSKTLCNGRALRRSATLCGTLPAVLMWQLIGHATTPRYANSEANDCAIALTKRQIKALT
jgi:hypothetical protein